MFTQRSSALAGNWTVSQSLGAAFIQHSWILLVFPWTCLVAEDREMIFPFPYTPCAKDCENSSIFFLYCPSQRPAGKLITKESPEEKVPALGHASSPDTQSPHRVDVRSLGYGYSHICLLVGSQFCDSHWDFLQPQILTPGRTEMTYSRLTTVILHHVWPAPEQPLCNLQPLCVTSIRILLHNTAPAEKDVLWMWDKHIQLIWGEHKKW